VKVAIMRKALAFALLLALAPPASPARADSLVKAGRAFAKANCSRCHAIGPTGESPNPKSPPFRTLSKRYPLSHLEEALGEGILVGHEADDMPAFRLSPQQIEALLAYLAAVQEK
jgi:cytochrome c